MLKSLYSEYWNLSQQLRTIAKNVNIAKSFNKHFTREDRKMTNTWKYAVYHCLLLVVAQSLSRVWLFVTHGLQHTRLPCPSSSPRVCSKSCPLSQWCHPTISFCHRLLLLPLIFPSVSSFPVIWLFEIGGQSIGASALASVLPITIQGWFPLGLIGLISLLCKGP